MSSRFDKTKPVLHFSDRTKVDKLLDAEIERLIGSPLWTPEQSKGVAVLDSPTDGDATAAEA